MPPRVSAHTEKLVCADYLANYSRDDIATRCGVSQATTWRILQRNGIAANRSTGPRNKIEFDAGYFDRIDSAENAYWLGFIAADGCVRKTKGGSYEFVLRLASCDKDHLLKLKRLLQSEHPIVTGLSASSKEARKIYPYHSLRIVSRQFVQALISAGVPPNKAFRVTFPPLPPELLRHFMRGYFDGDGCWHVHRGNLVFTITTANKAFAQEFARLLSVFCGIKAANVRYAAAHRIVYEGNVITRKIYNFLYKDATPATRLDRKWLKSTEHFGLVP